MQRQNLCFVFISPLCENKREALTEGFQSLWWAACRKSLMWFLLLQRLDWKLINVCASFYVGWENTYQSILYYVYGCYNPVACHCQYMNVWVNNCAPLDFKRYKLQAIYQPNHPSMLTGVSLIFHLCKYLKSIANLFLECLFCLDLNLIFFFNFHVLTTFKFLGKLLKDWYEFLKICGSSKALEFNASSH